MPSPTPLQLLLESAYQPTDSRREAVLAHDWSDLPRIAAALAALPRPVTSAALSDVAWRLVDEAVDALSAHFPPMPGTITPLEVVRCHVLDRQPWPSLEAQLLEEGRPVSRGTLIRRQHEFLPAMQEWAKGEHASAADAPEVVAATIDPSETHAPIDASLGPASVSVPAAEVASAARRPLLRLRDLAGVAILLAVGSAVMWIAGAGRHNPSLAEQAIVRPIPPKYLGRTVEGSYESGGMLPAPYPPFELPNLEGDRVRCMILEPEIGQPRLLLTYRSAESGLVRVCSWDPLRREMLWESEFDPPVEERMTHATLEEAVYHESFFPSRMFYEGVGCDLGEWFVVYLIQKYSPMYALFVRMDDGTIDGYYVHPGSATAGRVFDLDGDGRGELVMVGQDNALNLPALAVLQPGAWKGAASTVMWNVSGEEGAYRRVLLPDWPSARERLHAPRLEMLELTESDFDPATGVLTAGVGNSGSKLYHARLDADLRLRPESPFVLYDSDRLDLQRLGLELPDFEGWTERVLHFEGPDRRKVRMAGP